MLALAIAISLALTGDSFVQNTSVLGVGPLAQAGGHAAEGLIPFGQALGTYSAPTLLKNGSLLALLEDAAGNPLWVLDAEIQASGAVGGQLSLARYASNPASGMVQLAVTGHVQFNSAGEGVLSATIYSLSLGAIPIYPMGKLEGLLKPTPSVAVSPTLTGKSGLVAMAFDLDEQNLPKSPIAPSLSPQGGVIVCPKGPDAVIAKYQGGAKLAQASAPPPLLDPVGHGHALKNPKGPDVGIGAVQSVPNMAQASGGTLAHEPIGHVINCPKGPDFVIGAVQSAANMAQAGGATAFGQGVTKPYFQVDPVVTQDPSLSTLTAAGAHAQLGTDFSAGKQGVVCLNWWLRL